MLDWSIIDPPISLIVLGLGLIALGYLLWGRSRRWWRRVVPTAVAVGLGLAAGVKLLVDLVWRPFPDGFSWLATAWIGLFGGALTLAAYRGGPPRRAIAGVLAVLTVLVAGLSAVNVHFASIPTVRALLGAPLPSQVDFSTLTSTDSLVSAAAGQTLAATWAPPPDMPAAGVSSTVSIPGSTSGFAARSAWIYLPPAYLGSTRAVLPVLVLTSGQPGSPRDWFDGGDLVHTMDAFAAGHQGLAPVVVSVDALGTALNNPLCLDSPRGNSFSYLSVDVPAWIRAHLQVSDDPQQWAFGGFSAGGTCALQLAVNAPQVYPTFIDIAGDSMPSLGSYQFTVDQLFGGDAAAFAQVNPLDVLAHHQFPGSTGLIVAGVGDEYRPAALRVLAATKAAGMTMTYLELPGTHSWRVWKPALAQALPWFGGRTGLTE